MKISIITVAYNSGGTIADTLQSVAQQDYFDIEHIVVDGGSTDNTTSVVRQYSHVSKLISEPDRGIYDAMNKGLAHATGAFIGFLNADDSLFASDSISTIAAAAATPGIDALYGDLVYVRREETDKLVRRWAAGHFRHSRLKFGWMPPHPTLYVSRALFERVGKFDLQFRISADYDFMLRCLTDRTVGARYIQRTLVRMRTGGASNRSLRAVLRKSSEDLKAMRKNGIGGFSTLVCKNLRKLPQWVMHQAQSEAQPATDPR